MGHLIQSSSSIGVDLPTSPAFTCQPKFCSVKMSDKKPIGAKKRKVQREKEKGDRELLRKIPKLTGYFKAASCRGQEYAEVEDVDHDHRGSSSTQASEEGEAADTSSPEPADTSSPEPADTSSPEPADTSSPEPADTSSPEPADTSSPSSCCRNGIGSIIHVQHTFGFLNNIPSISIQDLHLAVADLQRKYPGDLEGDFLDEIGQFRELIKGQEDTSARSLLNLVRGRRLQAVFPNSTETLFDITCYQCQWGAFVLKTWTCEK